MNNDRHYDVIIIGTGAGGGTLARKLAPTGKRILLLERGDYVPREKDNWSTRAVNVQGKYQTKEVWHDRDGKPLHPHTNYCVGGNTKFYGAALFRLRREDFCAVATTAAFRPPGRSPMTNWSPITPRPSSIITSTASAARIRPIRPPAGRIRIRRSATSPASSSSRDDFAAAGLRPFHTPLGVQLDEKNPHASKCIRCNTCDGFPCLVYAKSDAQVLGVDPALEYPERRTDDQRLCRAAGDQRVGPRGDRRRRAAERRDGDLLGGHRGGLLRRHQFRGAAAALGERPASARAGQRLRRGRPPLHGAHQFGPDGRLEVPEPGRCSRRRSRSTISISARTTGSIRWATSRSSASWTASRLSAGAPAIAPGFTLDLMANHSLDFWLTSEDLPDPDNRVTLDRDGNIVLSYTPNNEEGHTRLIAKLKDLMKQQTKCAVHGHDCHQGLFSRNLFVGQRIPLAGVAHQNGTIRFGNNPRDLGARPQLQGARSGQSLRRGWQLLPVERRGQSGADHHGQRAARGRSPDREDVMMLRRLVPHPAAWRAACYLPATTVRWSTAVDSIGLTVSDLDRSVAFYSNVLHFRKGLRDRGGRRELRAPRRASSVCACGSRACGSARSRSS